MQILLIDDEPDINELVSTWFVRAGHEVDWMPNGEEGLLRAAQQTYDAIILDVLMPGLDGFEVLEHLRENQDRTPVIMLTSVDDEKEIIGALRNGADGYMTKPFSPPELEARVLAICRRAVPDAESAPVELVCGDLRLDRIERTVTRGDRKLRLTNIEFNMLSLLMTDPSEIVSHQTLLAQVWNLYRDPGTGVVHVHMSHLREKLTSHGGANPIRTVRGKGYTMNRVDP